MRELVDVQKTRSRGSIWPDQSLRLARPQEQERRVFRHGGSPLQKRGHVEAVNPFRPRLFACSSTRARRSPHVVANENSPTEVEHRRRCRFRDGASARSSTQSAPITSREHWDIIPCVLHKFVALSEMCYCPSETPVTRVFSLLLLSSSPARVDASPTDFQLRLGSLGSKPVACTGSF